MKKRKQSGFTLVEIMIVVVIIGLLAAIALPIVTRSRIRAQNVRLANDLRIFSGQISAFVLEGNTLVDSSPGVIPAGLDDYIRPSTWSAVTSVGGQFDIQRDGAGFVLAVGVSGHIATDEQLMQFEQNYDDNSFSTGRYQKIGSDGYYFIIETR